MADATASITIDAIVKGLNSFVDFTNQLNKAESEAGRLDGRLQNLENTAESLDRVAQVLQNISDIFASITKLIITATSSVLDSATSFDKLYRSLVFVSGGVSSASVKLKELEEVAKLPGLGFREAIQAQIQLQSTMKLTETTATNLLKSVGKGVAVSGGGKEEFERSLFQFTQIAGRQKFEGEDINTISEKIRNFKTALEQEFGATTSKELNKIVDKEGIDKVFDRISKRLDELNKNATNLDGTANAIENLSDAVDKFKISLGTAILKEYGQFINLLASGVNYLRDSFTSLTPTQQKAIFVIAGLVAGISALIASAFALGALITSSIALFATLVGLLGSIGLALATLLAPLVSLVAFIPVIITGVASVIAVGLLLYESWKRNLGGIKEQVIAFVTQVEKDFERLTNTVKFIYETLLPQFQKTVETILNKIEVYWKANGASIMSYVSLTWNYIVNFISTSLFAIQQSIELVLNLINGDTAKALLNAQTIWYYFVTVIRQLTQTYIDIMVYVTRYIVDLMINFNAMMIKLAIEFVKNYSSEIIRGLLLFLVGGLPAVMLQLISKVKETSNEWYEAGRENAENYQKGFEQKLRDYEIDKVFRENQNRAEAMERQAFADFEKEEQRKKIAALNSNKASGKSKIKDIEPIDADERARQKAQREAELRNIQAQTQVLEINYNRRVVSAQEYYKKLDELSNQRAEVEKREQLSIIERANKQLQDNRINNLDDRGKKADQLRAEITTASKNLEDIEARRLQAVLLNHEKYNDYIQTISDESAKQFERILDLRGEFDALNNYKANLSFDKKLNELSLELTNLETALEQTKAGDGSLTDFYEKRVAVLTDFINNLKLEKEATIILGRQVEIENKLKKLDSFQNDANNTETSKFDATINVLNYAYDKYVEIRDALLAKGLSTIDIDAKIIETNSKIINATLTDLDKDYQEVLNNRQRKLDEIAIRAKATGADEAIVDAERLKALKETAKIVTDFIIPNYEDYLKKFKEGTSEYKAILAIITKIKLETKEALTPDKAKIAKDAVNNIKNEFDDKVEERDIRLRQIERNQALSEIEKTSRRNDIIREYSKLLQEILTRWELIIKAQETGLNPQQIKDFNDELKRNREAVLDSESSVESFGQSLQAVVTDALASGLTNLFTDLINRTKSAKEAFADFARSFLAEIQKMIIKMIVFKLLSAAFDAFSGGGGGIATAGGHYQGGLIEGKASGGVLSNPTGKITGSGSPTSDSILTWFSSVGKFFKLSNREYVLDGETTSEIGVDTLDKIRASKGKLLQPLLNMAKGGSVSETISNKASAVNSTVNTVSQQGDTNVNVGVYLSPTEMIKNALKSNDGIMALIDAMGDNKTKIKTRLDLNGA